MIAEGGSGSPSATGGEAEIGPATCASLGASERTFLRRLASIEPQFPEIGVLALGAARWSSQWSSQERILLQLSRWYRVFWMNPAPHWRELLSQPRKFGGGTKDIIPHFTVLDSDFVCPRFSRPRGLQTLLRRLALQRAGRLIRGRRVRRLILSIWHPEWIYALDVLPHVMSTYHVKDEYSYSTTDHPVPTRERRLLESVDQVFVVSRNLLGKKGRFNANAALVPNGVDYARYAKPGPEPRDLVLIPHPRIGYTGWIKKQLDWDLVLKLAARHPEWSFVLVGAKSPHPEMDEVFPRLEAKQNVYLLGAKTSGELASYPAYCDALIMPYRMDDYTRYIYPLKLHEYLAAGPPVVGTPIPSLSEYQDLVRQPIGLDDWSRALTESLEESKADGDGRRARQAEAARHDWPILACRVAEAMADRLGGTYRAQFDSARAQQ